MPAKHREGLPPDILEVENQRVCGFKRNFFLISGATAHGDIHPAIRWLASVATNESRLAGFLASLRKREFLDQLATLVLVQRGTISHWTKRMCENP